jgi:PAS domain S-box-containing protein
MHRAFRRIPLPVKLLLIGIIPLTLLVFISVQLYSEKTQKLNLLKGYIDRIRQASVINSLIDNLQLERKYSYDYAMNKSGYTELLRQRPSTDSAIKQLDSGTLAGFTSYTFLDKLQQTRTAVDSMKIFPDQAMHYYTTAIYRLNTLNVVSPGSEVYLQPIYKDMIAQKLLSELSTSLGIMRSNIYNVLTTRKYMVETLIGMIGVHDIYKTHETEFMLKASPFAIERYKHLRNNTALKPTTNYLDTLFKRFAFDSTYDAPTWWAISESGMNELTQLQLQVSERLDTGMNTIIQKEKADRNRMLLFLVLALVVVICVIVYTISSITRTLNDMKLAAQDIAAGASASSLKIRSNDAIGDLAKSIERIEANNKMLAEAADAIGKGNFNVTVEPRGKDDILGNAVARMKDNLIHYIRSNKQGNEQLALMAEKYKTIFYKSPLPKWIYDIETLRFLEVNEAASQHYGFTRDEFLSMSINDIRPDEEHEQLRRNMELLRSGEEPENLHQYWRHRKKNGEIIVVDVKAYFVDHNEKKARMVVINDVTEKLRGEEQLKKSHEELRELASHLQNIREEERTNMAREVHDVLGQQITCIKMDVAWLAKHMNNEEDSVKQKKKEVLELIDRTAVTVRKIASELRPSILDDFGLMEALEWQAQEFEKRSGLKIEFTSVISAIPIPEQITTGLFRIFQESLTNISRHAAATLVTVAVELKDDHLIMSIRDNGKGFDMVRSEQKKTLGLLGMKERAIMMAGKLELLSAPGKGTTITVRVLYK